MEIKIGDQLILRDAETLRDQLEKEHALTGKHVTVTRSRKFAVSSAGTTVSFHIAECDGGTFTVIEKAVRSSKEQPTVKWGVFFTPEGLEGGTRKDWVESGRNWLFKEPSGPEFDFDELEYADQIPKEGLIFRKLGDSFAGQHDGVTWMITEWLCTTKVDDPRILVLETGDHVRFFLGADVGEADIEIYAKK